MTPRNVPSSLVFSCVVVKRVVSAFVSSVSRSTVIAGVRRVCKEFLQRLHFVVYVTFELTSTWSEGEGTETEELGTATKSGSSVTNYKRRDSVQGVRKSGIMDYHYQGHQGHQGPQQQQQFQTFQQQHQYPQYQAPEVAYVVETGGENMANSSYGMALVPSVIGNQWNLTSSLGHGSFGHVFLGRNIYNPTDIIAVKLEFVKPCKKPGRVTVPYVVNEAEILHLLQGQWGFPQLIGTWRVDKNWVGLGMTALGPSLAALTKWLGGKLAWQSIVAIASQVLFRLQALHSVGFVHRDVKPHNLLMGLDPYSTTVHLVDFGLSKSYIQVNRKNQATRHIPQKKKSGVVGTAKFSSVFVHEGSESSMRDDLESLAYTLIWLATGKLPWDSVESTVVLDKETKHNMVHVLKQTTSILNICKGAPLCVSYLLSYARDLKYGAVPDYDYLQSCFHSYSMDKYGVPPHALKLHWHDTTLLPPLWNQTVHTFD